MASGAFDDLLAPARNELEDNPFDDPFMRPRSPDPWATFGQSQLGSNHDVQEHNPYQEPDIPHPDPLETDTFKYEPPPPPPQESHTYVLQPKPEVPSAPPSVIEEHLPPSAPTPPSEPEPVSLPTEKETPQTSGYSSPLHSSPPSPSTPVPSTPSQLSRQTSPPPPPQQVTATSSTSSFSPPPERIRSPLDAPLNPVNGGFNYTFSGLSLGGETSGGWGAAESTFVNDVREPVNDVVEERHSTDADAAEDAPSKPVQTNTGIAPLFTITVDDPQKVGDPIRGYTLYTVTTKTTSPLFAKPSFSVLRRYSDFLWLYETLVQNNPGVVVPPVPEKHSFGRFQDSFVEQRRVALTKCIHKIANHSVLAKDPDLKLFLESDSFALDVKQRKAELANERGGLMANIGSTITGPKFYETDEWFDQKKAYLDALESQLRGLVKAIDLVSKQRYDVTSAIALFSDAVAALADTDLHGNAFTQTLLGLADVEKKVRDLLEAQARDDVVTVMATADEYARLINSVRLAFASRIRCHATWQAADSDVRRVRAAQEKARKQGRLPSDRLTHSLAEIQESERHALEAKREYDNVSKLIKAEMARFEHERVEDFKNSLEAFLNGMIGRQKEIIRLWEVYQEQLLKRTAKSSAPGNPQAGGAVESTPSSSGAGPVAQAATGTNLPDDDNMPASPWN
ncbi:Vps5-domain-containing protein [Sistotremastrum suecicum HHB10207 ss-3]|uniref:Vps5-domain-containing protein n=1 Tax=Sistotremastrum suecicum HHB10207 ss-3 TaxID=1314776 RepID=A0A166EAH4_9AGAM|nr:Vps5-domain-containing protein [Sistotremastrum suecicum HHB10207 ss-3]